MSEIAIDPLAGRFSLSATVPESSTTVAESASWAPYMAAGALVAGAVLLATGHRRAGVATAAAGAALALASERRALRGLWDKLPSHLQTVRLALDKAEGVVEELSEQARKLRQIVNPRP